MDYEYHLNKSGQTGVFGVRPHTKNTMTANYWNDTIMTVILSKNRNLWQGMKVLSEN